MEASPSAVAEDGGSSGGGSSVRVALHIRPLIADERIQGCTECVIVVPGQPQVQLGAHSFTFDHVYGGNSHPSTALFEECITPLVNGLFEGYNGTVLAYGQTGSGKTYTMGTSLKDNLQTGVIPEVMTLLFDKLKTLKHQTEFQLHVSFIEILKEEVRDLLDSSIISKLDGGRGHTGKVNVLGRAPIQIRETSNGAITLAGLTKVGVGTRKDMLACLEQGLVNRATGSTNMNNQSSRSHAIFTITLDQKRKLQSNYGEFKPSDDMGEEYICAKLHLVDLAGSERAKRTGSGGLRLKEGIHINKGLLALGNVISALGDEKKRKEGIHIPYRDSKLTRLLQDSLGGNSKTLMIACISPADINAEETLNTLKYANRARNIRNKPVVNQELISNEMQKMRQRLDYLQAELSARLNGASSGEVHVLKERIAWLEAANENLSQELHEYRSKYVAEEQYGINIEEGHLKRDGLKRGMQHLDSANYPARTSDNYRKIDEEVTREWEQAFLQTTLGKELNELNIQLQQKESEMKLFGWPEALKQHFGKKIVELEEEKRSLEQERDRLLAEIARLADFDGRTLKLQESHSQKLKSLEAQILDLKKKQESQLQILKQKQRSEEAAKRLQNEIQFIKAQKVQLQHKIKQELEQFRQWKASREKELVQLRKEGRRNEFERHKLQALNQRQKMVLQRKTEEAAKASKRLKELLEVRKSSARGQHAYSSGHAASGQSNGKTLQQWLDHELEVILNVHAVRFEYRKQMKVHAALAEELTSLRQVDQCSLEGHTPPRKMGDLGLPPSARLARIASLENMLSCSSNALVLMASQLSEAEARQRECGARNHRWWDLLRSMADARNLLQYMFNAVIDARCHLFEKEAETKELKEQLNGLVSQLGQSEVHRNEIVKDQKLREQAVAIALATSSSETSSCPQTHSDPSSPRSMPAPKQPKCTAGVANGSVRESAAFFDEKQKMVPIGHLSVKKLITVGQGGKLWRWKRSHRQWLLQFKWKWQKPWKLSEWNKHCDETILRSRPRTAEIV